MARMKIITKSRKGIDMITRVENIEIKGMRTLEEEVRAYNTEHYGEELLECGLYQDFETFDYESK